eukprot:g20796.t1
MRETFRGLMEDVAFCSLLGLQMVLVTSIELRPCQAELPLTGPIICRIPRCRLWRRLSGEALPANAVSGTKVERALCH